MFLEIFFSLSLKQDLTQSPQAPHVAFKTDRMMDGFYEHSLPILFISSLQIANGEKRRLREREEKMSELHEDVKKNNTLIPSP